MTQVTSDDDIKKLGTILSVWAHPDDESFCCAGIMATAVANGQTVVCLTATKGEAGVQDESRWPAAQLGEIRAKEMRAGLDHLGIKDHFWLGYGDGQCQEVDEAEAAAKIKQYIDQFIPQTIFTFGPDGLTGHSDHQTVSRWVDLATKDTGIKVYHTVEEVNRYQDHMIEADKKFNIYFNIDKPPLHEKSNCDIAYVLPPEILAKKLKALQAMPSQMERMFKNMPSTTMQAILAEEFFILTRK